MRGSVKIYANFDDIIVVISLCTSKKVTTQPKGDGHNPDTKDQRTIFRDAGAVRYHVGSHKKMGLPIENDESGQPFVETGYQVEIQRRGLMAQRMLVVPHGGKFPDSDDPDVYGAKIEVEKCPLKDLLALQVRAGDSDEAMEDIEADDDD
jgi:hypothetical protein